MAQGKLRVLLLWHMHQPFYKDLVSGEYRLPWVRLHALKDYYGMVKLLEEFPQVHQNFNIVPSLVAQIEDYNSGVFKDPFWEVAAKPAGELSLDEKHFALTYFFQAHGERMIGRYPRYRRLWEQVRAAGADPANAAITFGERDYRDLQVLSQLAWFDEYYLAEPAVRELIVKGQGYSEEDQRFVMSKQHEILRGVLPAYRAAVGARLGGAFDDAVLSPDSSAAVRHQHGARVGGGTAAAERALPASGRRRGADTAGAGCARAQLWDASGGNVAERGIGLRRSAADCGGAGRAVDGDRRRRAGTQPESRDEPRPGRLPGPRQRRKALQHLPLGARRARR